ncbi:MAG: hypothetical protein EOP04_32045 [Proteobacteria bacterium]|nr:MAG: hypothetical protein EOP04_32045 [Pseudomonadota bacterium]
MNRKHMPSDNAASKSMSPRVLSALSYICVILFVALTYSASQDTPRGSLLWYLEGFTTLFIMGYFLSSAYATERSKPPSPRRKKVLLVLTGVVLVMTLSDATVRIIGEQQRQFKNITPDESERELAKIKLEMKRIQLEMKGKSPQKTTLADIQRLDAQLKNLQMRIRETREG